MLLTLLLVLEVIIAFFLIVVVLLQRSEGGGFVSGGTGSLMSVRGAGDLLTRTTWILGTVFFVLGLLLTIVAGRERGASSVADRLKIGNIDKSQLTQKPAQEPPGGALPGQPTVPAPTPLQAPAPGLTPFTAPAPTPAQPAQPAPK